MVDTGGFVLNPPDKLVGHIREQTELAIGEANVIVFIVDSQIGINKEDETIARLLRTQMKRKPNVRVVLAVNKIDADHHKVL